MYRYLACAEKHPEKILGIVSQNGNVYEEGSVSPDGYSLDLYYASVIPDYAEKQSNLIFDYQNNVKLYPLFQEYLRKYRPKLLAVWGREDPSFIWAGAEAFRKDLPDARIVPVASGHFALLTLIPILWQAVRRCRIVRSCGMLSVGTFIRDCRAVPS